MKTMVKDFSYRGEHFSIVFDGKLYMTVNHKFIGDDGRLVKELHYTDGLHTSDSLDDCIKTTKQDLDIEHYMAGGKSKAEAFSIVYDMPMELAERIFGNLGIA